ncbi:uncharacterized protein C8R40DRAFT_1066789 [Lentinula edodes]|uniref:uncharacterized protein n=1 Tax=Lentinula edodes TaxID=5353 RepID=UPI001E8DDC0D|nr:uncharacterized protein C8R40DRAFT_1066789 [Lentinula edodes]KAH7879067.1 hypothetical protein C8R40DRAFT_1066789 [Lentinula edodes]
MNTRGSRGPGSEATSFFGNIGSVESVVTEFNDNLFVEPEIENDIEIELEEEAVWKEEELRMLESVLEVSRLGRASMTAELVAPLEGLAGDTRILEVMFWNDRGCGTAGQSWGEAKFLKEKKTAVLRRGAETRLKLWNQLKADEKFDEIDTMCSEVGQPMLEKEARTFYKIAMQSRNEKSKIAGERLLNLNVHGGFGGDDDGRTGRKKHVQELHWVHNPLVTSFVQGGGRRLQRCAANSSRDIPNIPHKGSTTLVYAVPLTFPPEDRIERDSNTGVDSVCKVSVGTFGPVDHSREPPPTQTAIARRGDGITSGNKDNRQGRRVCLGRGSGVNEIVILSRAGYEPEEEDESSNEFEAEGSSRFRWLGRGSKSEVGVAPVNRIFFKISRVHRKVADGAPADRALENPITKSIRLAGREGTSFTPV